MLRHWWCCSAKKGKSQKGDLFSLKQHFNSTAQRHNELPRDETCTRSSHPKSQHGCKVAHEILPEAEMMAIDDYGGQRESVFFMDVAIYAPMSMYIHAALSIFSRY